MEREESLEPKKRFHTFHRLGLIERNKISALACGPAEKDGIV